MYFKNIYKTLRTTGTEHDESKKTTKNGPRGPRGALTWDFTIILHPS